MLQTHSIHAIRGDYTVRLARTADELAMAQALRYRVFYDEMGAKGEADGDSFDPICDHLVVLHGGNSIVGTYRLLRQDVAEANGGFYSESEFFVRSLIERKPDLRFLELGRSCVLREHRSKPVLDLLWQGIWNYVRAYRMDVMFGCASFEGADAEQHAETLSYLWQNHAPPPDWHAAALPKRAAQVRPRIAERDLKQCIRSLPPLVKGYLRVGSYIGEGAVEDHQFGTTDVLVILPVSQIQPRYFEKFGPPVSE